MVEVACTLIMSAPLEPKAAVLRTIQQYTYTSTESAQERKRAGVGATTLEEVVLSGFNATLPQASVPPTVPARERLTQEPSPIGSTPTCAGAAAMLTSLCCNIRQGITQMARMRCCVWCAGAQRSDTAPLAVFVTNSGGIGLVQRLPKWLIGPLCNLQDMLVCSHRSGGRVQPPVFPPRASAHEHRSTWCSYSYREPFAEKSQWQQRLTAPSDDLYNGGAIRGFTGQSFAIDAELLRAWMMYADEHGKQMKRSSNGNGSADLLNVPWRAIRTLSYLNVFGLMYVPAVRSLEQELLKL